MLTSVCVVAELLLSKGAAYAASFRDGGEGDDVVYVGALLIIDMIDKRLHVLLRRLCFILG